MMLAQFLAETRRKWLQAFKLFKNKNKKSHNRVSPTLAAAAAPARLLITDERDIDVAFCSCRAPRTLDYDTTCSSYSSSEHDDTLSCGRSRSAARSDSAYESARSSPGGARPPYASVTYFNVNDSEDSCTTAHAHNTIGMFIIISKKVVVKQFC
ncbi:unnamed protein product [Leptidea sinapis]|uniref:Uncharacterized protein n=1 Tax=Leptidea sinapis TaxID=189913 RepID=A0A5E4Q8M4_9NEOP|nr:unnamed protein product [Leptidea sinapis]